MWQIIKRVFDGLAEVNGKRVLVCGEERHIVRLVQANFQRQSYRVDCVYDASEAIRRLETAEFELAVVDKNGSLGPLVLEYIRTNPRLDNLKVVNLERPKRR